MSLFLFFRAPECQHCGDIFNICYYSSYGVWCNQGESIVPDALFLSSTFRFLYCKVTILYLIYLVLYMCFLNSNVLAYFNFFFPYRILTWTQYLSFIYKIMNLKYKCFVSAWQPLPTFAICLICIVWSRILQGSLWGLNSFVCLPNHLLSLFFSPSSRLCLLRLVIYVFSESWLVNLCLETLETQCFEIRENLKKTKAILF